MFTSNVQSSTTLTVTLLLSLGLVSSSLHARNVASLSLSLSPLRVYLPIVRVRVSNSRIYSFVD